MIQAMLFIAFLVLLLAAAWSLWTHAAQRAQEPEGASAPLPDPDPCGGDAERGDGMGGTYDLEDAR